jgi:hypothetical protein
MTAPLVDLDERTRDDLRPPCDAGKVPCFCPACGGAVTGLHNCDQPATHVLRSPCDSTVLVCCLRHVREAVEGECATCHGDCVTVTPL